MLNNFSYYWVTLGKFAEFYFSGALRGFDELWIASWTLSKFDNHSSFDSHDTVAFTVVKAYLQKLAKTGIYLTPKVCTERIFDSRPFMYHKMFLKKFL